MRWIYCRCLVKEPRDDIITVEEMTKSVTAPGTRALLRLERTMNSLCH